MNLLRRFWEVCLLRAGPQDLPASDFLLVLTLLIYIAASFLVSLLQFEFSRAGLVTLVDLLLMAGLSYLILWIARRHARWLQTMTALSGSGAVLSLAALPFLYWSNQIEAENQAGLPDFVLLGMLIWNLVVLAHIFRHALSVSFGFGAVFATLYLYISTRLIRALFMAVS